MTAPAAAIATALTRIKKKKGTRPVVASGPWFALVRRAVHVDNHPNRVTRLLTLEQFVHLDAQHLCELHKCVK